MRSAVALALVVFWPLVLGQAPSPALAARQWRQQHERAIIDEFVELLRIPNVTSDRPSVQRNAEFIAGMLRARGIEPQLLSVPGGNPVVFGRIQTPGATRTIVFYAHYDGQPVDPREWSTPPFAPTLRTRMIEDGGRAVPLPAAGQPFDPESRLYARSAGDDKAPIVALMTALDALRAARLAPAANVTFVFEGEEETGSAHLQALLAQHRDLFAGDIWLMCDGPVHQTRRPLIYFGSRDVATFDVTVYGPSHELHSGHYGNWAPNPAMALARLLASMKDTHGRVLVDGFYDDVEPLGPAEKAAIAAAPDIDAQLMEEFGLGSTEGGPRTLTDSHHRALAQRPRPRQRARRRRGRQRDSGVRHRVDGRPAGQGHGPGSNRRPRRRSHPEAGVLRRRQGA